MPTPKRVLLVDDDTMLRGSLAEQLAADGSYTVVEAGSCAEGRARAGEGLYEFMILDVGLPDGDGRELCREFRDMRRHLPDHPSHRRRQRRRHDRGPGIRAPTTTSPSRSASPC